MIKDCISKLICAVIMGVTFYIFYNHVSVESAFVFAFAFVLARLQDIEKQIKEKNNA
jgi:hypothetical protein